MVNVMPVSAPLEGRQDKGVAITSKDRPQNPVEGTTWTNPVTNRDEIFYNGVWTELVQSTALLAANNLSDVASAATARGNLGLGTLALQDATSVNLSGRVRLGGQAAKSGNYTMGATDCGILGTSGAGGITITLPAANTSSQIVIIVKVDAGVGALTVARAGSDTINGATSISLTAQYDKCVLWSDGAGSWYRLV